MTPFSHNTAETIESIGEISLIDQIRHWLGALTPPSPYGMGDDCALVPEIGSNMILTVDSLVYGQHFNDAAPASAVGAKLLKRNISDIAAMGGNPRFALIALCVGPNLKTNYLKAFYEGLSAVAAHFNIQIIGGDISASAVNTFCSSLTLIGNATTPCLRKAAVDGDSLWVTGKLGGSILKHHLEFIPRLEEGLFLANYPTTTSMMDLTDGLAKDLWAMMPKGCDIIINTPSIPLSEDAVTLAKQTKQPPLFHAFCDGEDYELLFSLSKKSSETCFLEDWTKRFKTPITRIGTFVAQKDLTPEIRMLPNKEPLPKNWHGYEHLYR